MDLGRYRLLGELGRGGMGIAWLAEMRGPSGFEKRVVVKELRRDLAADPVYQAMFVEEARLAARLRHRNVVQTNELGREGDRWFMVLELLEGASLHCALSRLGAGGLPLGARVRVVCEVLAALHYAHELRDASGSLLGVVHRDVSPSNVFLTFDGQVKLLDFGVAKCRGRALETKHGVLKGSVAYMSPDHVAGATIDRRADIFAAGVLLREMITEQRVWADAADVEILRRLIARDVPGFPETAMVPADLRAICERAMASNRADRFGSADEMRDALERWLSDAAPSGSLSDVGARLERVLAESAPTELAASALVTDLSAPGPTPSKPRTRWAAAASLGATALLAMVAMVVATTATMAVARDALVGSVPVLSALPSHAAAAAPPPAPGPEPIPELVSGPPTPIGAATMPLELPPNPYAEAEATTN